MKLTWLCQTGLGDMSRLSSGLDPWMSRDPTPKKVLYAKSDPMSDRSWRRVKTFFGVGSLIVKGSNPEESFIHEVRTYVWQVLATHKSWLCEHCQNFLGLLKIDRRRSMSIICSCSPLAAAKCSPCRRRVRPFRGRRGNLWCPWRCRVGRTCQGAEKNRI